MIGQCPNCYQRTLISRGADCYCSACGYASTYPDTADIPYLVDMEDLDTDEELPCVHADGCPGWQRCLVCYDREEGPPC